MDLLWQHQKQNVISHAPQWARLIKQTRKPCLLDKQTRKRKKSQQGKGSIACQANQECQANKEAEPAPSSIIWTSEQGSRASTEQHNRDQAKKLTWKIDGSPLSTGLQQQQYAKEARQPSMLLALQACFEIRGHASALEPCKIPRGSRSCADDFSTISCLELVHKQAVLPWRAGPVHLA